MNKLLKFDRDNQSEAIYRVLMFNALLLVLFGLFVNGPSAAYKGLLKIFISEAPLISDYFGIGGIGSTFLNSGLAMLFAINLMKLVGVEFKGLNVGCCFIVGGFAFFGKTLTNMIPIVLGTYLYSLIKKEKFKESVNVALFATCAGPFVQYMAYNINANIVIRIIAGFLMGVLIGLIVPIVAGLTAKIHNGILLFNVGFATGFVLTVIVAILKGFGFEFKSGSILTGGNNLLLSGFLLFMFGLMIIVGLFMDGHKEFKMIFNYQKDIKNDYMSLVGLPSTLINMGILGLMMTAYVVLVKGELNGPTLAAIITVCGFGAFGMNCYNVIWGMLGIVLLSFVSVWKLNETAILLGAIFSNCIVGIAGKYGPLWGMASGMLHISIVRQAAVNYGWLNLYNNGYAAGLVCLILLPIIYFINENVKKSR